MKQTLALCGLALTLLSVGAAPSHAHSSAAKKVASATTYQCQKCHMKVSAATAKKDGYKDPMDGGKLVPMKNVPAKAVAGTSMPGMKM